MEDFLNRIFYTLIGICVLNAIRQIAQKSGLNSAEYTSHKFKYLAGYTFYQLADWVQGPVFTQIYTEKGLEKSQRSMILTAGFASSALLGTFIAGRADRAGRKNVALQGGFFTILSGLSLHSSSFPVLVAGRVCGGIGASILHSALEAWGSSALQVLPLKDGDKKGAAGDLFFWSSLTMSTCAILGGILASFAISVTGETTGAFDASVTSCAIGIGLIYSLWSENYGNTDEAKEGGMLDALRIIFTNPEVFLIGVSSFLFEGIMFTFVFNWWDALFTANGGEVFPAGIVFACFMSSVMLGSSFYSILASHLPIPIITSISFALMSLVFYAVATMDLSIYSLIYAFLVFEFVCGIYFPALGTLRYLSYPDSHRTSLSSLIRFPAMVFVVVVNNLYSTHAWPICSGGMAAVAVTQLYLALLQHSKREKPKVE